MGEVISSQRTQDGYAKLSKESRNAHNRQAALNLKSGSSQAPAASAQGASSYRGNGPETRRTAEEYEAQIVQFEELAAQYEKEMNELRQSNDEQNQDLHTMIQTVDELKEKNTELEEHLQRKDLEVEEVKGQNFEEIQAMK